MKQRMTKKGFRLISVLYFLALVALSFSVYTFFQSSTFAWFLKNETVDTNGLTVSAENDHRGTIALTAYKYDLDSLQGVKIDDKDEQGNYLLEMNQYDTIFSQLNVYNGLLLKFNISLGHFSSFTIDLVHDASKDGNTPSKLSKYLSSVCVVKAAIFEGEGNTLNGESADTLWSSAKTKFDAIDQSQTFVSKKDGVYSKKDVSFSFTHPSSQEGFDVYFWIDYSPELVTSYLEAGEADAAGSGVLSGTGTYTMANDITLAQASFVEAQ